MKKSLASLMIASAAVFTVFGAFPAMAADSIEDIDLEIISYIKEGDTSSNVSVRSLSYEYTVSDVDVTNEPDDDDEWEEGDTPKLKITLSADGDDYKFTSSISKDDVDIRGNDATVTKVSRSSSTKFYVYVTLDEVPEDDGTVSAGHIGAAQPQSIQQQPQPQAASSAQSGWVRDGSGWKWGQSDSYIRNQWKQIDNKWYYFDANGYMATGWQQIDGKWYYLDENGEMLHDTITPDGYRVGSDGVWVQ